MPAPKPTKPVFGSDGLPLEEQKRTKINITNEVALVKGDEILYSEEVS